MKRVLVVAAAGLAAVALYTTTAPAGQEAVTPGQFAALSKKVTKLQKDVNGLGTVLVNCVMYRAYAVKQYGGLSTEGYVYQLPDATFVHESALDFAPPTDITNVAWLLSVDPACASIINSPKSRTLAAILRSTPAHARLNSGIQENSR
ncbi:MAG: hypothetical protein M3R37_01075 [Actinomycetota bacterium]|nr:hypothetical protein [Actinomycetota bacterium]